jgi:MtN3 and saliva related transmembrane protein
MNNYDATDFFLGTIGGVLMTLALLPQLIKLYRTRSAKDLSAWSYILYAVGILFWCFYGIARQDWLFSVFKLIGVVLSVVILVGIWRYRHRH